MYTYRYIVVTKSVLLRAYLHSRYKDIESVVGFERDRQLLSQSNLQQLRHNVSLAGQVQVHNSYKGRLSRDSPARFQRVKSSVALFSTELSATRKPNTSSRHFRYTLFRRYKIYLEIVLFLPAEF